MVNNKNRSYFFFLSGFFSHTCGIWKFLGQGLNPSQSCNLHHNCQILNPLHRAREPTDASTETRQIINPLCHSRNSFPPTFFLFFFFFFLFFFLFSNYVSNFAHFNFLRGSKRINTINRSWSHPIASSYQTPFFRWEKCFYLLKPLQWKCAYKDIIKWCFFFNKIYTV